jgi:carbonic anhydrase/acetyltransferase-like protein (isoleucine patch superfamily)
MQLPYLDYLPALTPPFDIAPTAAVIGRTVAGAGLTLRGYATVRGDGEWIRIGANAFFGERATVHIADGFIPTLIGGGVTVGRYALVHACTLGDGVVVADAATVMDGATVGAHALIAPGALVPPRKTLAGGFIYAGNPAQPLRTIGRNELDAAAAAIRRGEPDALGRDDDLPPLGMASYLPANAGPGPLHALPSGAPQVARALVATAAAVVGDVRLADESGIFFGCAVVAGGARIEIGARSNIQDNSILVTDRVRGDLIVGNRVTFGHNVRMGSGVVEDDALVGMSAKVGDRVVVECGGVIAAGAWVEPGTVVKAGWIWAGRPAREFRPLRPAEREGFDEIIAVYTRYAIDYRRES